MRRRDFLKSAPIALAGAVAGCKSITASDDVPPRKTITVEWNKNVAARLDSFPGLDGLGLVETNGHQNYRNWETMRTYHPCPDAPWSKTEKGVFNLDRDFYDRSGGIFAPLPHYEALFT